MCQTHKKQNFHGWGIDTISIVATSPRFGTIAKNHIQSSKVITRLLFFCSEYVTSLKNFIAFRVKKQVSKGYHCNLPIRCWTTCYWR